jgi:mycothiol synthase
MIKKGKIMNAILQDQKTISLPEGFTARGALLSDVEAAYRLFNRWSQAVIHEDEIIDAGAIRIEWVSPNFDPARDIRVVFAPNGQMAGYVEVWTTSKPVVHPWIWGRVDPDYQNLGIGTWLLAWADERSRLTLAETPADLRVAPRVGAYRQAEDAKKLFEAMGFHYIRSSYQMRIDLNEAPPAPVWPEGITVRTYTAADLEALYRADDEAFRDHFGHVEQPLEQGLARFKHFMIDYEDFDPTLYFLAMDGGEIAGISLCRLRSFDDPDMGYVNSLGVRRPWRKHGLGMALLRHSFGEFYRRGQRKAGLHVDASNLTGALRLYEGAGMHIHRASDMYEKEIRPGREISVESL